MWYCLAWCVNIIKFTLERKSTMKSIATQPHRVSLWGAVVGVLILTLASASLVLGGLAHAQDDGAIEHPENDDGVVAVFTAVDPEMETVSWSIPPAGDPDDGGDLTAGDNTDGTLFAIDENSGELTFMDEPDFEDPQGGTGDDSNTYMLVVAASDGVETAYKAVAVEVTNEEETATTRIWLSSVQPQVSTPITVVYVDEAGNPFVDENGAANMGIEDPDNVGTDANEPTSAAVAADDVEWQWSKSSSKTGTYEDITGDDAAKTATYTPASQDRDMYLRVTATYEDGEGEGKTVVATSAYPVRAFPSGNSAPAFPTDFGPDPEDEEVTLTAPEAEADDGAMEGENVGDPVEANDANNDRLTYSLEADTSGGAVPAHADLFYSNPFTGQVRVGLDRQVNPDSDSDDNVPTLGKADSFTVTIKATDPSGEVAMVVMTITVDEVDEAPVFTAGKASHSHAENEPNTEVVYTFDAYDAEGDTVEYSLSGDDAGKFTIGSSNGEFTFDASPDFEARGSADGDNTYEVTVKATSNAGGDATEKSTTVDVTVEVTNVDELGEVSLSASEPRIGVEIRANTPVDPDGGVTDVTWQWSIADNAAFGENDNVTKIKDATMAGYTPVTADDEKYLRVTASYTDAQGSGKTVVASPTDPNVDVDTEITNVMVEKVRNLAPVFTDEDTDTDGIQINPRAVAEGSAEDTDVNTAAAPNTAAPVVATDTADADGTDDNSILYLLSGADAASFDIDSDGQITVGAGAMLDYEDKDTYMVTVTARDPEGLNSSVDVTIMVTDVNEAPEISGPSSEMHAENDDGVVAVFTAADPEMKDVTWSIPEAGDPDGAGELTTADNTDGTLFAISKAGELTFVDAPDYEDPAGGTGDNSNTYTLVVAALDGTETGYKKVEVEVTNEEETATTGIEMSSLQPQVSTAITVAYVDGAGNPFVNADGDANTAIVDPDQDKGETDTTIPANDVEWQWSKSSSRNGTYTDITVDDAAETDTYTPASQDRGMYLRVTATYDDGEGEGKTVVATSMYSVRAFPSGNSAPAFPTDFGPDPEDEEVTLTAPEAEADDGAMEGENVGDPVEANDANNDRLTYSLEADTSGGAVPAHADLFQIDRMTGQVTVGLGRQVNPDSDSDDNVPTLGKADSFTVTIKATDPSDEVAMVVMTITVDEVDEAPVFTAGKASHSHAENEPNTEVVYTFDAYDAEGDTVEYSLSGDDAGKFTIGSSNGEFTFDASPDFEARGSADGDNTYEVTVKATSNAGGDATEKSTTVDVTVEVTNVDELGEVSLSASEPRIGVEIRANTPVDPDGGVTDVTWQWSIADNAAFGENDNVTKIKDATMAGYTPVTADDEKYLRVTASYTDAQGSGKTVVASPTDPNVDVDTEITNVMVEKVRNLAPAFTDEDDDTAGIQINPRAVAENSAEDTDVNTAAAPNTAAPVVATDTADADDTDNDDILYLLSGADSASFDIDSDGQITVGSSAMLDHEDKDTYMVTVTARDPEGLNSSVDVTIMVTDVNEPPVFGEVQEPDTEPTNNAPAFATATDTREVAEDTAAGENIGPPVEATDADADDTLTYTLGGGDAASFDIDPATGQIMTEAALDFETKTSYSVTVTATDGTDDDVITVTITVTDVDDSDPLLAKYDNNPQDRKIGREEVLDGIDAFFLNPSPALREEVLDLIDRFFADLGS